MTEKQARHLLTGTVVTYEGEDHVLGTVLAVDQYDGVHIAWSDGLRGWTAFDKVWKLHLW
jgi:hypothetical protein